MCILTYYEKKDINYFNIIVYFPKNKLSHKKISKASRVCRGEKFRNNKSN